MQPIEAAIDQVSRGDDAGALKTLVEHWRGTRSPSIAEVVDLLGARAPDDLSARLAAVVTPRAATSLERLREVAGADDPRLGRFALDALANPPFCAPSGEPLLLMLVDVVDRLRDVRLQTELPRIRSVLKARLARLPMFQRVAARLDDAVKRQQPAPAPEPAEEKLRSLVRPAKTAEALLADVYANPGDDPPRRVYADFLLERGDVRGELISLQLSRRPGAAPTPRETQLLAQHGKKWLGPLAIVVTWGKSYSQTRFERGFLSVADFIENPDKKTELIADDPAWATVERLQRVWPNVLLAKAPLRALKALDRALHGEVWEALSKRREPLNAVSAEIDRPDVDMKAVRRVLPKLDTLRLVHRVTSAHELAPFLELDVRRLDGHSWWRQASELPAAKKTYAKLLADVEGALSRVAELRLHGPFSKPGEIVEPDVFVRDAGGRLRLS